MTSTTINTNMSSNTLTVSSLSELPERLQQQLEGLNIEDADKFVIHFNYRLQKPKLTQEEKKQKQREACLAYYYRNKDKINQQRHDNYYKNHEREFYID